MADNVTIDNGGLSDYVAATDDIAGAHHPYVKVEFGADGTATKVTSSDPLPTTLSNLEMAEDEQHTTGDSGIMVLAVRKDTAATLASQDTDYTPLIVDDEGKLWVNVGEAVAAARTTDSVSVAHATDVMMNGVTELTPKFFSESVAASDTDEELVAAVASKKIRVLALAVHCGGTATTVTFESSTTTRKHKVPAGVNGGQILPFNPVGWFETASGESLTVTTGTGSTVEISGVYVEV